MAPIWSNEEQVTIMTTNNRQAPASELNEERLVAELKQALRKNLFSSRLRISPRRANQMAQELAASFLHFLEREDEAEAHEHGQALAQAGLSHQAALALSETLRRACWESANPGIGLLPISGRYVGALLSGYMEAREAWILQEQQRAVQALQRVMGRTT
jgi:hypothetical protein